MNRSTFRARRVPIALATLIGLAVFLTSAHRALAASDGHVWGQDPFVAPPGLVDGPNGTDQAPAAPAELQGIIAGPGGMVAIIDSRIVRIGDRVGAELVEEITPRAVTLRRGPHVRRLMISVLPTHGR